jgi:hypothetical protein
VKPEEKDAAELVRLGEFIKQQREETLEEARRSVQSQHDQQTAKVARQLEEAKTAQDALTEQIRVLQTTGLSDEDKAKVREGWAQQDERLALDAYRTEVLDTGRAVTIDSLLLEFRPFGVARESLEAIKTTEEMELHCEQAARAHVQQQLTEAQAPAVVAPEASAQPAAPVAPAQAQQPVPTEPAQPAQASAPEPQPNAPGVPAGASAPSDVGSGGAPAEGEKFSKESSAEAMQENLRNMRWDTARIRQA